MLMRIMFKVKNSHLDSSPVFQTKSMFTLPDQNQTFRKSFTWCMVSDQIQSTITRRLGCCVNDSPWSHWWTQEHFQKSPSVSPLMQVKAGSHEGEAIREHHPEAKLIWDGLTQSGKLLCAQIHSNFFLESMDKCSDGWWWSHTCMFQAAPASISGLWMGWCHPSNWTVGSRLCVGSVASVKSWGIFNFSYLSRPVNLWLYSES